MQKNMGLASPAECELISNHLTDQYMFVLSFLHLQEPKLLRGRTDAKGDKTGDTVPQRDKTVDTQEDKTHLPQAPSQLPPESMVDCKTPCLVQEHLWHGTNHACFVLSCIRVPRHIKSEIQEGTDEPLAKGEL